MFNTTLIPLNVNGLLVATTFVSVFMGLGLLKSTVESGDFSVKSGLGVAFAVPSVLLTAGAVSGGASFATAALSVTIGTLLYAAVAITVIGGAVVFVLLKITAKRTLSALTTYARTVAAHVR